MDNRCYSWVNEEDIIEKPNQVDNIAEYEKDNRYFSKTLRPNRNFFFFKWASRHSDLFCHFPHFAVKTVAEIVDRKGFIPYVSDN